MSHTKCPVKVLVTGAAGNIGYAIIPIVASGAAFGSDQPIILHLLDLPFCEEKMRGVAMEIEDCAFSLVTDVLVTTDIETAFRDLDYAFLVGSFPRKDGMERKELLAKNADIFRTQGMALDKYSKKTVKVVVVGNPANTNALITQHFAPSIPKENITAMTRLDHSRASTMLAKKTGVPASAIRNMIIWGNHSSTQVPDATFATSNGKNVKALVNNDQWFDTEFIESVQKRGATVIKARGLSSAFSAAMAAVNHMHDWVLGTPADGSYVSMAVSSDGSYGIEPGVVYSYPVTVRNGKYSIVQGLQLTQNVRTLIAKTHQELLDEKREALAHLGVK